MEKYRADNSHCIGGQQVNRSVTFSAQSEMEAIEKFKNMRKEDPTIQEAGLFLLKDESLRAEYIGYI